MEAAERDSPVGQCMILVAQRYIVLCIAEETLSS